MCQSLRHRAVPESEAGSGAQGLRSEPEYTHILTHSWQPYNLCSSAWVRRVNANDIHFVENHDAHRCIKSSQSSELINIA